MSGFGKQYLILTQNDDQGVETSMKTFLSCSPIIIINLESYF